jgi:signal peptidase I
MEDSQVPQNSYSSLPPTLNKKTETAVSEQKPKKEKGFFRELLEFALIALIIVIPFRIYIAQPFVVNGASMDPTFKSGEYLIVDQISYRFNTPLRGSILIFKFPKDPSKYFIKRVIGLPGETVSISGGKVTITNSDNPEGITLDEPYIVYEKKDSYKKTLDDDEYFVMGDNRLGSADSRLWGPLPKEDIVGRPILRLFPASRAKILPGDESNLFKEAK